MKSQDLDVNLLFLQWQKLYEREKPFQIFIDVPNGALDQRDSNLVFEKVMCKIQDIRRLSCDFQLDDFGFTYINHASKTIDFSNRKIVDRNYLPEIEVLLKRELHDVDRVFLFDWRVCNKNLRESVFRCHAR